MLSERIHQNFTSDSRLASTRPVYLGLGLAHSMLNCTYDVLVQVKLLLEEVKWLCVCFMSCHDLSLLSLSEADPVVSWHVSRWWQADATYAAMAVKVRKCLLGLRLVDNKLVLSLICVFKLITLINHMNIQYYKYLFLFTHSTHCCA